MKPISRAFGPLWTVQACLVAAPLLFVAPSAAQPALLDGEPAAAPTFADVETGRKAAEEDGDLAEDVKAKVLEYYDRAAEALGQSEALYQVA